MSQKQPEQIQIALEDGYRPHFALEFERRYGPESVFVLGVADCLTSRHVRLLVRANRIAENTEALKLGPAGAREAIEGLITALITRNVEKPVVRLLQISTGQAEASAFEADINAALGAAIFGRWLEALERRDFEVSAALLAVH